MVISQKEREYLRNLAKKQLEYANTPENKQRQANWYAHNDLQRNQPMVTIEDVTFFQELARPLTCESDEARQIEENILNYIIGREDVDDDRVTPDFYGVYRYAWFTPYGIEAKRHEEKGRLAYTFAHHINDLETDFYKLGKSTWGNNMEEASKAADIATDVIGDILPIRLLTSGPYGSLAHRIICLMSMETMLFSMMDYPELFHKTMEMLTSDYIEHLQSLEQDKFFIANNSNQRVPMGTYSFTNQLPSQPGILKNMWGFLDAQECVGISCDMFNTFFFPYYKRVADLLGIVNYGCCEPVHDFWDECISKFTNLRKVSISAWCDEDFMGNKLRGGNVIYHRKPSPNVVCVDKAFDEEKFVTHIKATLKAAEGCKLEFSFRDVYSLQGDKYRAKRCVELTKQQIEKYWS